MIMNTLTLVNKELLVIQLVMYMNYSDGICMLFATFIPLRIYRMDASFVDTDVDLPRRHQQPFIYDSILRLRRIDDSRA